MQSPNHVVKEMYVEINSISQGLNIGLLVLVITTPEFQASWRGGSCSAPLLALTNLLISIIFWARYYFDTEILQRSFTIPVTLWFFGYIVAQGVSVTFIAHPVNWLISTGVFLFFGCGFYAFNLMEIRRKQQANLLALPPDFSQWQSRRLLELLMLSALTLVGAGLVRQYPAMALPIAVSSLAMAIWQLVITNDYRTRNFIETGV